MRPLRLVLVLISAIALAGCVSTAGLESQQTPTTDAERTPAAEPAEPVTAPPACAEWVGDLTALVPLDEVLEVIESADRSAGWSASGDDMVRGKGACAPVSTQPTGTVETCTAPIARLDDVSRAVGSAPVEYMFAAGAQRQLAGYITGRVDDEQFIVIAVRAWRFPSASEAQKASILDALAACPGAQTGDGGRVRVYEGTEPTVVSSVEGRDVFVVRSARPVTAADEDAGLTSTTSSLLPEADVNSVEQWWRTEATTVLDLAPVEP